MKGVLFMSKIFIDPGHGGYDPGACYGNIKEKDIVLDIGLILGELLIKEGFKVGYSRTNDNFVSLSERVNKSNRFGSDIFISIHCNAFTSSQAQGVETFYYRTSKNGKRLADKFQTSIVKKGLYTKDRGIKQGNFYVLRRTRAVAVLLELGFISNWEDRKIIMENKRGFAEAVVEGLKEYFG